MRPPVSSSSVINDWAMQMGVRRRTIWVAPSVTLEVARPMADMAETESRMSSMVSEKKPISKPRSSARRMRSAISRTLVNFPYPSAKPTLAMTSPDWLNATAHGH